MFGVVLISMLCTVLSSSSIGHPNPQVPSAATGLPLAHHRCFSASSRGRLLSYCTTTLPEAAAALPRRHSSTSPNEPDNSAWKMAITDSNHRIELLESRFMLHMQREQANLYRRQYIFLGVVVASVSAMLSTDSPLAHSLRHGLKDTEDLECPAADVKA